MFLDFRNCDVDRLDADVCVVGAGAAGLSLAYGLTGRGLSVLVVESGGVKPDAQLERLNEGDNIGSAQLDLVGSRRRVFGGATTIWAGQCVRLEEEDLIAREWVAERGWPMEVSDLDSGYDEVEALLGIRGVSYGESNWAQFGISPPALDPGQVRPRFTVYPRRTNIARLTRKTFTQTRDVRVLLHANATELVLDGSSRPVRSLVVRALEGRRAEVRARVFALCAGAIENARLLLSSSRDHPKGLGNHHDLVGRFLQDHPNAVAAHLDTADHRYLQDRFAMLYRRGRRFLPRMILSAPVQRAEQVLNAAALIAFEYPADSAMDALQETVLALRHRRLPDRLGPRTRALARDVPALAAAARRRYLEGRSPGAVPERIAVQVFCEQAPDPSSRVTLSSRRDALGCPVPGVDWRLSSIEGKTLQVMLDTVDHEMVRLGAGRLRRQEWVAQATETPGEFLRDAFHHMGTTRISDDPRHGVVNRDLQVHGIENLFVAGASVFPTSSWANPTLTAMALSARLAEHLHRRLA